MYRNRFFSKYFKKLVVFRQRKIPGLHKLWVYEKEAGLHAGSTPVISAYLGGTRDEEGYCNGVRGNPSKSHPRVPYRQVVCVLGIREHTLETRRFPTRRYRTCRVENHPCRYVCAYSNFD